MVESAQVNNELTLTEGGPETHMIFLKKRDLNNFALFECLKDEEGKQKLTEMYESYLKVGQDSGNKLQLGTPTWRASA